MKVAIVGASGNAGTALLHALRDEARIDEIVGIARRTPDTSADPYDAARWERIDIAVPAVDDTADARVIDRIAEAIAGADCVVHLAWLIQPNHRRDVLRRANVDGTRRVIEACLRAGVGHLVCASSVGAYAGVRDDRPRDESWPATGIPSSHYAVDKAAQERLLDDAEARGLRVARLRPALVFDRDAASEITRLFVGALVPPALLRPGGVPVLPLPAGLRVQVVHGADVADAYRRAIVNRATGPFNIATEPLLRGGDLAAVLDHGRHVAVPSAVLRPLLHVAWRAHAIAADPGWLDMAMRVPVMDTSRARRELGWSPQRDARDTLRELLTAVADGAGTPSAPLRPRKRWPQDQLPPGDVVPDRLVQPPSDSSAHRLPATLQRDILGLYLSDHLTGATAGVARFERMARAYADTDLGPDLRRLAAEVRAERTFLRDLIATLELPRRRHRQALAWLGEKAGRLKTNGRPLGSPMTPVLETELMRSAVMGKLGAWEALAELSGDLGMPRDMFTALAERTREQAAVLERLHRHVVPEAFRRGAGD